MEIGRPNLAQKNALVVDDDEVILKSLSGWLEYRDWNVVTACDGTEAFKIMTRKNDFDLVLTDYNMPRMNGLVLAEKIKDINPLIRVILVTGTCSSILEREINIIYIDDVLHKPFSLDELDNVLDECITRNSFADLFTPAIPLWNHS
ncbi:MAG: response regulator [Desulfatiglans sp.]|jgi:CheY-like chemotaxis protein|nr:response regulator [Desulfatiglans sp.]